MSAAAVPAGVAPAQPRRRVALELALFGALAAFAVGHWSRLVGDPPLGRLALVVAIALAGAGALAILRSFDLQRGIRRAAALLVALGAFGGALVGVGLPAWMLVPSGWPELLDGVRVGLAGIEDVEMPYDGTDSWVRLTLLLGSAAMVALAAAIGFWPAARGMRGRIGALVLLLVVYGVATTLDSPARELYWGLPLLVLAGAWLWLPALGGRRAAAAVGALVGAGALALPLAAALESERPWWNYESWDWFNRDRAVSFEWNHSYGPLEWPREGTTLLAARSPEPLYWKAAVLDRFDGFTWQRADPADTLASAELVARRFIPDSSALARRHPEWLFPATLELRGLRSELVVTAGTPRAVEGIDAPLTSRDGTVIDNSGSLESGDEYSFASYAPQPTAAQMRAAPTPYPRRLAGATLVGLPALPSTPVPDGSDALGYAPSPALEVPLWGEPRGESRSRLLGSAYADAYRLARRLTAAAPTAYDATVAIETHLREGYDYTPNVPEDTYPLRSFLFDDGAGYCQQFSGSMALMLRMVGIPSRVVSGFAPGSYDEERDVYEVRDFDAHSWVEVYFRGLGWVVFDPTPSSAPAVAESLRSGGAATLRRDGSIPEQGRGRARSLERALAGGQPVEAGAGPWGALGLASLVALAVGIAGSALLYLHRRRVLAADLGGEARARELLAALQRLGWKLDPAITLKGIERRSSGVGRRAVASYAATLRELRYGTGPSGPPPGGARRQLRRALGAGGPRRRLRALAAIPPGGPGGRGEGRL